MVDKDKLQELESRVNALERRFELLEQESAVDERRNRRVRALNMWMRIGVYAMFLVLMVLALVVFKARF